jgi:hypothetical protein
VAASKCTTGFLGYSGGDRAAGGEIANEDIGEQLITLLMRGA